jgi:hypothetical protein
LWDYCSFCGINAIFFAGLLQFFSGLLQKSDGGRAILEKLFQRWRHIGGQRGLLPAD